MSRLVRPARVVAKGLLLFLALEYGLVTAPLRFGPGSMFSWLDMPRERLPVSTLPAVDESLDVGNLDAMFSSHAVSRPKAQDEFRVLVLGDSAVWGLQLTAEQTLPAQLDRLDMPCGEKRVRVYNLSFPRSSATKDLFILDRSLGFAPDMIVWLITWYTLMPKTRLDHWLITRNPDEFRKLGTRFDFLPHDYRAPTWIDDAFNRNSTLFRVFRYQLYPLIEKATGREQIAGPPEVPATELAADLAFEGMKPPALRKAQVSLDQIVDFYELASHVPVLLVNEPMLVVRDMPHSDVRYNSYYPRWIYDQYRDYVAAAAAIHGWTYMDLWDHFAAPYFTDTPLHLSPLGQRQLAEILAPSIQQECR